MVNTADFKERLELILSHYELSASAFADAAGVQRSSISHLLSGRNKPSLDFVLKVVQRFPEVNLYWLLNGRGTFPESKTKTAAAASPPQATPLAQGPQPAESDIESIVVFYKNGSFRKFSPSDSK